MRILLLWGILCCCSTDGAAQFVERKIHQVFNTDGIDTLSLNVEGEITQRPTPGKHILLETTIRMSYASLEVLDALIKTDRYKLEAEIKGRKLIILAPRTGRPPINIRGRSEPAMEFFSYRVFTPEKIYGGGE